MTDKDTYYSRPEILKRRRAGRIALLLSAAMYFGATGWVEVQAADYYWSGASSTSDNIDQGDNWHTAGTPSPGDYLYFNNTSGSRHYPYSNYGAGSWFENIITYSGAGGITWKGDKTYAKKFENSDDSNLFEIQASIENRDTYDLELNPTGSGGMKISGYVNVANNDKWIKVYGNNQLEITQVISGNSGVTMTLYDSPTVILSAANTFPGALNIYGGVADLRNTTDPLDVGNIYIGKSSDSADATLRIGASGVTVDNPLHTVSGNSGVMRIDYNVSSGSGTFTNTLTLNKDVVLAAAGGGQLILSGSLTNAHKVVIGGSSSDSGTVRLTGTSGYSGKTEVKFGTLEISNDRAVGAVPSSADATNIKLESGTALVATETFTLDSNRGITLTGGNVFLAAADTKTLTYNGILTDGAETRAIVKNQGGTVVLGGNNTFEGGVYVDAGELSLTHNSGAGTGQIYLGKETDASDTTTLTLKTGLTVANAVLSRPASTYIATICTDTGSGDSTLSGTLTLSVDGDVGASTKATYLANNLSSGSLIFDDVSLNSGGDENRIIYIDGPITIKDVADPPSGGHYGLVMRLADGAAGDSALTLDGAMAANFYLDSGDVTWGSGFTFSKTEFQLGTTDNAAEADENASITFPYADDYTLNIIVGFIDPTLGSTGSRTLDFTETEVGDIDITGAIYMDNTDSSGKYLIMQNAQDVNFTGKITFNNSSAADTETAAGLIKRGAGQLTFAGDAEYKGNTYVDKGTLKFNSFNQAISLFLGAETADDETAKIYVAAGGTLKDDTDASTVTVEEDAGSGVRIIGSDGSGDTAYINLPINMKEDTQFYSENAPQEVIFNDGQDGNISDSSGANAVRITGAGIITFEGNNDYTGATTVEDGTLRAAHANALGDDPAGSGAGTTVNSGATLDIYGGITLNADETLTINGIGDGGVGALYSSSVGGTYTGNVIFGGVADPDIGVYDALTLTLGGELDSGNNGAAWDKVGNGRLTLAYDGNDYAGAVIVKNGYLRIQDDTSLGAVGAGTTVNNGGTLEWDADEVTFAAEPLTISGTGEDSVGALRIVSGNNIVFPGTITLAADALIANDGNSSYLTGPIAAGADKTVTIEANNIIYADGAISGTQVGDTGALIKTGVNRLEIGANNSGLTGDIYLNQGLLRLDLSTALAGGGKLIMADGTSLDLDSTANWTVTKDLTINGNVTFGNSASSQKGSILVDGTVDLGSSTRTITVNNPIADEYTEFMGVVSSGGLTKAGDGRLILSGANDYADGTIISAGALQIGNGASGSVMNNITDSAVLEFERSNAYEFSGIISGIGSVKQQGSDVLTLSGDNTYQGLTTVSSDTLKMGSATALGSTDADTTVASGATLDLNGQTVAAGEDVTIEGAGDSGGALVNNSGTATLNGNITMSDAATIGGTGDSTLIGTITGTTALTKEGAGIITVSGNNAATYTGAGSDVTVAGGTLKLGHAGALGDTTGDTTVSDGFTLDLNGQTVGAEAVSLDGEGISSAGALLNSDSGNPSTLGGVVTLAGDSSIGGAGDSTLSGAIGGAFDLTKVGAGTISLTTANGYTGATAINAGALNIQNDTALGTVAGDTTVASGAALQVQGGITVGADESLEVSGGGEDSDGVIRNISGANALGGDIDLAANSTLGADAGTLTLSGIINEKTATGPWNLTKVGDGTLILSGDNLVDGTLTVSAGLVQVGHEDALDSTSAKTIVSGTGAAVDLNGFNVGAEPMDISGTGIDSAGAIYNDSVSAAAIGGAVTLTDAASIGGSGDVSYGGTINGSDILTKVGAGKHTLTVGSDPEFTGKMVINAGTLAFTTDEDRLGEVPVGYTADQMTLNGGTLLSASASSELLSVNRGVTLNENGGTLSAVESGTLTVNSVITGIGALTKADAGTVVLAGANDFSGVMTVSEGTLSIGAGGTAGSVTTASIVDNAILIFNRSDAVANSSVISGTGTVTKLSAGVLTLNGNNTYSGLTTISGGTLKLGHLSALGSTDAGTVVSSGFTLDLNGLSTVTEALVLNGTGIGAAGALVNNSGTATHSGAISLNTASRIGGTGNATLSGIISGANNLTKGGINTITLSGNNTHDAVTTVDGGTLKLGHNNALGTAGSGTGKGTAINNGFTLDVNGMTVPNEYVTVSGDGIDGLGAIVNNSGTAASMGTALTCPIALAANTTIGGTGNMTLSNQITGAYTLDKVGAGTIVLSPQQAASTYSGLTTVSAGVLQMAKVSALGPAAGTGTTVEDGAVLEIKPPSVGMTIYQEALTLHGMGISDGGALRNKTYNNTWPGAVTLATASRINSDEDTLTITGGINGSAADKDLLVGGAGNITVSAEPMGSNVRTLSKDGAGTFTLSVASTYSGGTIISNGTMTLGAADVVPNGSAVDVKSVGTFNPNGNNDTVGSIEGAGAISLGAAHLTSGGNDTSTAFIGQINGSGGSLAKEGIGTLVLSYNNTYSGPVYINAGTVSVTKLTTSGNPQPLGNMSSIGSPHVYLGSSGKEGGLIYSGTDSSTTKNLDFPANGTGVISVAQSGQTLTVGTASEMTGTGSFRKRGAGTLYLEKSGAYTYAGRVNVDEGIMRLRYTAPLGAPIDTTVADGSALELYCAANTTFNLGANLALSGLGIDGAGALRGVGNSNTRTYANNIIFSSAVAIGVDEDAKMSLSGRILGQNLDFDLIKVGAGELEVVRTDSGTRNYYWGQTIISNGCLSLPSVDYAFGRPPTNGVEPGNVTINGGMLYRNASDGSDTISADRGLTIGPLGGKIGSVTASTITYDGQMLGSGDLYKTTWKGDGTGTLVLGGNNTTYSGKVFIESGTLAISHSNALGTVGSADVGTEVNAVCTLELRDITTAAEWLTIAGAGAGDVSAAALYSLSGDSTFSGPVALSADASLGANGAASLTLNSATAISGDYGLTVQQNGNVSISSVIGTGPGTLTKTGSGVLTLSSAGNTFTGSTAINGGTVRITQDNHLGTAPGSATAEHLSFNSGTLHVNDASFDLDENRGINLAGAGTIQVDATRTVTYGGIMAGTGSFTKSGEGTVTLSGVNTYNGATAVQAGRLIMTGSASNSVVTVQDGGTLSGTLVDTNGVPLVDGGGAISNLIVLGNGIVKPGNSRGRLTVESLELQDNAQLFFNFGDTSAGPFDNRTDRSYIVNKGAFTKNPGDTVTVHVDSSEIVNWDMDDDNEWILIQGGITSTNGFVLNTDDWDGGVGGNAEIDAGADFFLSAVDGNLKLDYNIRFFITRGWTISKDEARAELGDADSLKHTDSTNATALEWYVSNTADVTRVYDLIHWDSTSFQESTNNDWQLSVTSTNYWYASDGGMLNTRDQIRFYRAAYKDRWDRTENLIPRASEDVYALHSVILSEGYNYVGLHGQPYTNTFAGVFGADTNIWPPGASLAAGATKIEFYTAGANASVSEVFFFGNDAEWYASGNPTPVTTNLQSSNFFIRGFSITLPSPLPANYVTTNATDNAHPGTNINAMVWHPVLKVPTNGPVEGTGSFTHEIATGEAGRPDIKVYNVVSLSLPISVHPSQMRLTDSGFVNGTVGQSDEIYTMNTSTKGVRDGSTIYCDAFGVWRFVTGNGMVPWGFFKPNDIIVIVSRNGGVGNTWTWTYAPSNFYTLPTRWMGE